MSLGTGVYHWPLEIAAKIALSELSKSEFESTMLCVADGLTREAYQGSYEDFSNLRAPC